jgi:hypothetical protein
MALGFDANRDINKAFLKERVVTSPDATTSGVLVQDAETARAQQMLTYRLILAYTNIKCLSGLL